MSEEAIDAAWMKMHSGMMDDGTLDPVAFLRETFIEHWLMGQLAATMAAFTGDTKSGTERKSTKRGITIAFTEAQTHDYKDIRMKLEHVASRLGVDTRGFSIVHTDKMETFSKEGWIGVEKRRYRPGEFEDRHLAISVWVYVIGGFPQRDEWIHTTQIEMEQLQERKIERAAEMQRLKEEEE